MTFQLEGHLEGPIRRYYSSLVFHFDDKSKWEWSNHSSSIHQGCKVTIEDLVSDTSLSHWKLELSLNSTRSKNITSGIQNTCQLQPYGLTINKDCARDSEYFGSGLWIEAVCMFTMIYSDKYFPVFIWV